MSANAMIAADAGRYLNLVSIVATVA